MKPFLSRDEFRYFWCKKWLECSRGNFEIFVSISLFIYTAALCLSKPSEVEHIFCVAAVSRRSRNRGSQEPPNRAQFQLKDWKFRVNRRFKRDFWGWLVLIRLYWFACIHFFNKYMSLLLIEPLKCFFLLFLSLN